MKTLEKRFYYTLGTAALLLMLLGCVENYATHIVTVVVLSALLAADAIYARYVYVLIYRKREAEERAAERAKRHAENAAEVAAEIASFNPNRVA